jgi:hypothetical protein
MSIDRKFPYRPNESESEKASNSYLMSLIALMAGLPMPIINLLATLFFYLGIRRGTYFTRWHCTQALLSQVTIFIINATAFIWTMHIIFGSGELTNVYVGYLITAVIINLIEFGMTIYAAIVTRKGQHVEWWFWGSLTNMICKS